jgi:hypothetical protein
VRGLSLTNGLAMRGARFWNLERVCFDAFECLNVCDGEDLEKI